MRRLAWVVCVACAAVLGGCEHVRPYQRARLAHPTMVGEYTSVGAAHMIAIHEGAVGGGSAGEAGCGCN